MAAIPPPLRSATRSDWITSRARPTACRSHGWPRRKAHSARPSPARREFPRHSGARAARASPESMTTIGSMDSGPAPQVGNCRPKAHPGMTRLGGSAALLLRGALAEGLAALHLLGHG